MTADELVQVATASGLDVATAPNAADSSSAALLTTARNGVEPTPPTISASSTQASPTR
ncbi:hypothetical protein SAMN04515671_0985 [Nakamurella panacisegetis]|uniref:Uncharacterized protein n=1 Tax=Nakamurella panacisegetis TaxID=1090615 RepID=A0A1H0JPE5_9ACTN|nr:hypothetical protein [Nakamurella panacisegetis]SDO45433.1 hypothetical protein SAMN04515671_0985 [Nakamurella panacisegetis]